MFQCKKIVVNGSDVVSLSLFFFFLCCFKDCKWMLFCVWIIIWLFCTFFSFFYFSVCTLLCAIAVKLDTFTKHLTSTFGTECISQYILSERTNILMYMRLLYFEYNHSYSMLLGIFVFFNRTNERSVIQQEIWPAVSTVLSELLEQFPKC